MKKGLMKRDAMQSPSISLTRLRNDDGDPYQNLANAIICVAVDDYRTALADRDEPLLFNLQRFFRSVWCGSLTDIDTERLIDSLHREYEGRMGTANI